MKQNRMIASSTAPDGHVKRYEGKPMLSKVDAKLLEAIKGDEKASVDVSSDLAIKNYGTGCGTAVTVHLVCNQDADSILKATMLAAKISRLAAFHEHEEMMKEYAARMQQGQGV